MLCNNATSNVICTFLLCNGATYRFVERHVIYTFNRQVVLKMYWTKLILLWSHWWASPSTMEHKGYDLVLVFTCLSRKAFAKLLKRTLTSAMLAYFFIHSTTSGVNISATNLTVVLTEWSAAWTTGWPAVWTTGTGTTRGVGVGDHDKWNLIKLAK